MANGFGLKIATLAGALTLCMCVTVSAWAASSGGKEYRELSWSPDGRFLAFAPMI